MLDQIFIEIDIVKTHEYSGLQTVGWKIRIFFTNRNENKDKF